MATRVHVQDAVGNDYYLHEVDGIFFPEYFTDDPVGRINDIRNMEGRDDDILIAAYPKAGTHWVWEITNMLLRNSAEYHPTVKEEQMIELKGAQGADQLPSPRVFNTHLRFRQLPNDMIKRSCKILYINRNPKDMAVSRYYHVSHGSPSYKGTFSDYLPLYINGQVAFSSWFDYTLDWDKTMQDNKGYPIHCITYEELKRDPVDIVQKLAKFLGANSDEAFVKEVCDKCNFSNLKSSYHSKQTDKLKPTDYAFRKGQIGDWKNWFTVAMSEQFDAAIEEKLKGYDHNFIYQ